MIVTSQSYKKFLGELNWNNQTFQLHLQWLNSSYGDKLSGNDLPSGQTSAQVTGQSWWNPQRHRRWWREEDYKYTSPHLARNLFALNINGCNISCKRNVKWAFSLLFRIHRMKSLFYQFSPPQLPFHAGFCECLWMVQEDRMRFFFHPRTTLLAPCYQLFVLFFSGFNSVDVPFLRARAEP